MSYHLYKFFGSLSDPANLFAVVLLAACLVIVSGWHRGQKTARIVLLGLSVALVLIAVFPVGYWALGPLENRYSVRYPTHVEGIVMLTGDENAPLSEERGEPIAGYAAQRHLAVARLARRYPEAKIIISGDPTPFFKSRHTSIQTLVADNLQAAGVAPQRIFYETKSRTTHENAVESKALAGSTRDQTWLLVTSAYHMPRAMLCFENEGWQIFALPSDYFVSPHPERPYVLDLGHQARYLGIAMHEYIGLVWYRMAGWTGSLWP